MQADTLEILAGELIAAIRINTMRGTFAKATIEEVDEWLKPWIGRLDALRPTDHIRGVTKLIREEPNS